MAVRYPEISRSADDFFGSVVEVVSKRPHLGFELEYAEEASAVQSNKVPTLGRAEIAGQDDVRPCGPDVALSKSAVFGNFADKSREAVHVLAACNAIACSALTPPLGFHACGPELADSVAGEGVEIRWK
jgi:hypothetical protein